MGGECPVRHNQPISDPGECTQISGAVQSQAWHGDPHVPSWPCFWSHTTKKWRFTLLPLRKRKLEEYSQVNCLANHRTAAWQTPNQRLSAVCSIVVGQMSAHAYNFGSGVLIFFKMCALQRKYIYKMAPIPLSWQKQSIFPHSPAHLYLQNPWPFDKGVRKGGPKAVCP